MYSQIHFLRLYPLHVPTALNVIIKTFFPYISMIGLYVHMIVTTNNSSVASAASKAKLRVTRKDD